MTKRKAMLSVEDRAAVDIVLDHAASAGSSSVTRLTTDVLPRRVAAVAKLLHVLDEMPVADPPADLVARTMQRIDNVIAGRPNEQSQIAMSSTAHLH